MRVFTIDVGTSHIVGAWKSDSISPSQASHNNNTSFYVYYYCYNTTCLSSRNRSTDI